jgi:hypothetical protein
MGTLISGQKEALMTQDMVFVYEWLGSMRRSSKDDVKKYLGSITGSQPGALVDASKKIGSAPGATD